MIVKANIMALRILLADDHQIVRESFRALLGNDPCYEIVADVADGEAAVKTALALKPDIIVMDITMPIMSGIEATRQIVAKLPGIKVIALSMHSHQKVIDAMVEAGASAFIPKSCKAAELIKAIQAVMKGEPYITGGRPSSAAGNRPSRAGSDNDMPLNTLSQREHQILTLIADGYCTSAIAQKLKISDPTVATHRSSIMRKLKIESIAGLTKYAIREGLSSI